MLAQPTVAVIDDEPQIRRVLTITLESGGFKVISAGSANEGISLVASYQPQLIILDIGLPDRDGFSVVKELRSWNNIPIIILSVRNDGDDIVKALDLGADDYLTKPFNTAELMARVRATIRRTQQLEVNTTFVNDNLLIDFSARTVHKKGEELKVTNTEYLLLALFAANVDKVLTHKYILKQIWGPSHVEDAQYLRVFIGQLRKKIEDVPASPKLIVTEPGVGYRMKSVK
jgi:two-component system KDP operon response regulator KdpE